MRHEYYLLHKKEHAERGRLWRIKNWKRKRKLDELWAKRNPVKNRLIKVLCSMRHRCNNPKNPEYKHYGGRGIKCFLNHGELMVLWKRDKAWKIRNPCIDRINNDGNYEISNCQFLSRSESTLKQWKECRARLLKSQQAAINRGDWGKMNWSKNH